MQDRKTETDGIIKICLEKGYDYNDLSVHHNAVENYGSSPDRDLLQFTQESILEAMEMLKPKDKINTACRKITVTGIDDRTDLARAKMLQIRYPFLEYGILVSQNNTDKNENNRYPSWGTIDACIKKGIRFAFHVCGGLARDFAETGIFAPIQLFLWNRSCTRIQINMGGFQNYQMSHVPDGVPIIYQIKNKGALHWYRAMADRNHPRQVMCLLDASGGTGAYSRHTEKAIPGMLIGYAGGISNENIEFTLGWLEALNRQEHGENPISYWIDMESGVRTNDWLDLDKVEDMLRKAWTIMGA